MYDTIVTGVVIWTLAFIVTGRIFAKKPGYEKVGVSLVCMGVFFLITCIAVFCSLCC